MTPAIDITTAQRKTLLTLLRQFIPGVLVWAYGSRAKWTARPNSDLDLVAFTTPVQNPRVSELKEALAESNLPFPVDVHVWDEVPERFHKIIRNEYVVLQEAEEKQLRSVSEWREGTIADVAAPSKNALVGGPFGSNLVSRDYTPSGVPVIRGQNMGFGRWVSGEFVFVSEDKAEDLSANIARPGDLVFTQRGTLGQVAIVPPASFDRYIISQSQMKLTVDPAKADTKFLFYFFTSEEQQDYIRRNAIQTGVPHTNLGHLRTTPLLLPPLPEQRAIAAVLGALDDKIELNRRMNETLEALAQSLFKSWFVDATQSALPKGWREGVIADLGEIICGKTPPTSDPANYGTDIPFVTIPDMHGKMFVTRTGKSLSQQGANTQPTKTLPPYSICVSCIATPGLVILTSQPCQTNQQINSVVPNTGYSPFYCYFALRELSGEIRSRGSGGSVTANLNKGDFAKIPIALPPVELSKQFQELTEPVFKRILSNEHESRTLAALRDALLPKLLSGELRVPAKLGSLDL